MSEGEAELIFRVGALRISVSGPAEDTVSARRRILECLAPASSAASPRSQSSFSVIDPPAQQARPVTSSEDGPQQTESRDDVRLSFPPLPARWASSAGQLHCSSVSGLDRVNRAWVAGLWARATLDGRVPSPSHTPTLNLPAKHYIILRAPGLANPALVGSSGAYFDIVGRPFAKSTVSHRPSARFSPSGLQCRIAWRLRKSKAAVRVGYEKGRLLHKGSPGSRQTYGPHSELRSGPLLSQGVGPLHGQVSGKVRRLWSVEKHSFDPVASLHCPRSCDERPNRGLPRCPGPPLRMLGTMLSGQWEHGRGLPAHSAGRAASCHHEQPQSHECGREEPCFRPLSGSKVDNHITRVPTRARSDNSEKERRIGGSPASKQGTGSRRRNRVEEKESKGAMDKEGRVSGTAVLCLDRLVPPPGLHADPTFDPSRPLCGLGPLDLSRFAPSVPPGFLPPFSPHVDGGPASLPALPPNSASLPMSLPGTLGLV